MNKFWYGFCIGFLILLLGGCSTFQKLIYKNGGLLGKSSQNIAEVKASINDTEEDIAGKNVERLKHIGAWAEGQSAVLNKTAETVSKVTDAQSTNLTKEVTVAKEVNERIKVLSEKPDFNEVKEILLLVDNLLTTQEAEGRKQLAQKDKEIISLNKSIQNLNIDKEAQIDKAIALAEKDAQKADQYKATLAEMDSFFGVGAIWYGVKKLVTRVFLFLSIGGVLFLILRLLAMSNPIAGSIFSIVDTVFSWFIHLIKGLAPRAAQVAGLVEQRTFVDYKNTLKDIIDVVQLMKDRQTTNPNVPVTLDSLLTELNGVLDEDDKNRINGIKKELNWK